MIAFGERKRILSKFPHKMDLVHYQPFPASSIVEWQIRYAGALYERDLSARLLARVNQMYKLPVAAPLGLQRWYTTARREREGF